MEMQSSLIEESPVVTLKNGTRYSRKLVKKIMDGIHRMQKEIPNGAILINDLVMKLENERHQFFDGCQMALSQLGFVDEDGLIPASVSDILKSSMMGEGESLSFGSPYQH